MSDIDGWIYFDGPEPEDLGPLLDALRAIGRDAGGQGADSAPVLRNARGRAFAEGEPSVEAGAPSARVESEARVGHVGDLGITLQSPTFEERAAATPPAEPSRPSFLPVNASVPLPAVVRAPEALTITSVFEIPAELREQLGKLPFKPLAPGLAVAQTMNVPVMNRYQGLTVPDGDDSIAKAAAVLPFPDTTVDTGLVPFPRLSLEQYASLRAELSVWPERSIQILSRYYVMVDTERDALEKHWQTQLAASPEMRATFEKALADYTAWLRTPRV